MNRLIKCPAPFFVLCLLTALPWITACNGDSESHDVVVRGGLVFDGLGGPPILADVAIDDDTISAIAAPGSLVGTLEVDAEGLAVAPGFVNVLSWANESLLIDGRGQSDIRQGVTLDVMGEGWSMPNFFPPFASLILYLLFLLLFSFFFSRFLFIANTPILPILLLFLLFILLLPFILLC